MEQKIKDLVNDYNKHAMDNIPNVFFTVMLWAAAQSLINEAVRLYAPDFQLWQLALVEIFIASFGLWYVTRQKKEEVKPVEVKSPEVV